MLTHYATKIRNFFKIHKENTEKISHRKLAPRPIKPSIQSEAFGLAVRN